MIKFKKAVKVVLNVLIWAFVVFSVLMTTLALAAQSNADGIPAIAGKSYLTVLSPSMAPTIQKGDLIVCKMLSAAEKENLKKGDVVSFYADLNDDGTSEINTHRIIEVNVDENGKAVSYTTKGDNIKTNLAADKEAAKCQNVICLWTGTRIAKIGGFIDFLQQPKNFLVVIVLPLILLFLYQVFVFIKTVLAVKNSDKRQISAADEELIKQRAIEEYLRMQNENKQQNIENEKDNDALLNEENVTNKEE